MASGKVAQQSNIQTFSRFAVLESEGDSEEEKVEKENAEKKSNNAAKNAKRRARKKKKAVAETNELRNLAFSKPVSAKTIQKVHQQRHAVPEVPVNGTTEPSPPRTNIPIENIDVNWEEWRNKDEAFVIDQFQRDLENALRLSAECQPSQQVQKVKKKVKTMSLEEFVATEPEPTNLYEQVPAIPQYDTFYIPNGYSPEELDPNHYDTYMDDISHIIPEPVTTTIPTPTKKKKKKKKPVDNNTLSEVMQELHTEEKAESSTTTTQVGSSIDAASLASWKHEIEEKDKEINKLKELNDQLKDELSQVKKRNKQFCFILAQGEMKDKSEILLQVDDLTNIKNELSEQLEEMHVALEQERSKVSNLKAELDKQQNQRTKSKSTCEEK